MTIKIYRLADVMGVLNLSRSTILRMIQAGAFPQPTKLGRLNVWTEKEVSDWLESRFNKGAV